MGHIITIAYGSHSFSASGSGVDIRHSGGKTNFTMYYYYVISTHQISQDIVRVWMFWKKDVLPPPAPITDSGTTADKVWRFIHYSGGIPAVFPHHNIFSLIVLSLLNNVAWTQLVYICLQGNSRFFRGILEARHGQKSKSRFIVKLWSRYLQNSYHTGSNLIRRLSAPILPVLRLQIRLWETKRQGIIAGHTPLTKS